MARHTRLKVLTIMKETGVVPVFYNGDFETAKNIVCACADGGAKVVELTNRGDRAINVFTRLTEFRDNEKADLYQSPGILPGDPRCDSLSPNSRKAPSGALPAAPPH